MKEARACAEEIVAKDISLSRLTVEEAQAIIEKHMTKSNSHLVEALERIKKLDSSYSAINGSAFTARKIARTALAEHRKGG